MTTACNYFLTSFSGRVKIKVSEISSADAFGDDLTYCRYEKNLDKQNIRNTLLQIIKKHKKKKSKVRYHTSFSFF